MSLDDAHIHFLESHVHGRLATVSPNGTPQNKPVGYQLNRQLGTIDIAGLQMERSAKYRNVGVNPDVAFVVDDIIGEGADGTRFLEVRGQAEQAIDEQRATGGLSSHIIRIHPRRVVSWNVDPQRPGFHALDVAPRDGAGPPERPGLGLDAAGAERSVAAVARLVDELQTGIDERNAEVYNRSFAADVIWGSPFGATVAGYDELHAIHERLMAQGRGGRESRYEVVQTLFPTPDVAVAHVRRAARDADGSPATADSAFSEMALYVLVRRDGAWWLAAGQNTVIAPPPR